LVEFFVKIFQVNPDKRDLEGSDSHLHYVKKGSGERILVLFHGFGQDPKVFNSYVDLLKESCTLFLFDLYYHGESVRIDHALHHPEWVGDFESFLDQEQIIHYDIVGYSLGGRFALSLACYSKNPPQQMVLIAPDGLIEHSLYKVSTSLLFNGIFKYSMIHPKFLDRTISILETLGLAKAGLVRFAKSQLRDAQRRTQVYKTWTYFKPLSLSKNEFQSVFERELKIVLILGSTDLIIRSDKILKKFKRNKGLKFHLLPLKHHEILEGSKSLVASLLLRGNL
jgi:pimeloyl-ACP methyl ester carboxylesterase